MSDRVLERDNSGEFKSETASSGRTHKFVLRSLELEHRYHDEEPIHDAFFKVTWPDGTERTGHLGEDGKAILLGVPAGNAEVRYGPDAREYGPVPKRANPTYRTQLSESDIDALIDGYWAKT